MQLGSLGSGQHKKTRSQRQRDESRRRLLPGHQEIGGVRNCRVCRRAPEYPGCNREVVLFKVDLAIRRQGRGQYERRCRRKYRWKEEKKTLVDSFELQIPKRRDAQPMKNKA